MKNLDDAVVAIIGLGYVGLPLAVEFGKKYKTIGFDLSETKIASYKRYCDPTNEISEEDLRSSIELGSLEVTSNPRHLSKADFLIVAVPTPVGEAHVPDLSFLISASTMVGKYMRAGATVIYESTVYPGATEEICVPILEKESGLDWKTDFHIGYSPERVNPGDKERTITKITKVVSGDNETSINVISSLYESVITAGVYRATSIKVAEAAKVIENTQRDLNIALMNELSIIFEKLGIDSADVLSAASTKWNFLPFRPGLVGGHCIGVDPYYLTHKAEMLGYHPQVILSGRRINDEMAAYTAQQTIKRMIDAGSKIKGAEVVILGLTFKENCADIRNSKVADLVKEMQSYGCIVYVHDPKADPKEAYSEYGIELCDWSELPKADAIIAAVAHTEYTEMPLEQLLAKLVSGGIFVDVKSAYSCKQIQKFGFLTWRL